MSPVLPFAKHYAFHCSKPHTDHSGYPLGSPAIQVPKRFLVPNLVCIQQWDQVGIRIPGLQMAKQRPREVN